MGRASVRGEGVAASPTPANQLPHRRLGDLAGLARDPRLAHLFDIEVQSPYSYWFVCRPMDLENRPVRMFHDWRIGAGL